MSEFLCIWKSYPTYTIRTVPDSDCNIWCQASYSVSGYVYVVISTCCGARKIPSHMSACRCLGIGDSGPNAVSGVSMGRSIAMSRGSAISYSGNVIRQDVVQNMVGPAGFEPAAIGL